ncbi:MAG: hypothetical protein ACYC5N_06880 [Endomicrobiales bacterium]
MKEWLQKKEIKIAGLVLLCVAAVYALVYVDVVLRARSAFLQGEQYWAWHRQPDLKTRALDAEYGKDRAALDRKLSRGKLSREEFDRQLEILDFERAQRAKESSIKYAYIWYQTAVELFSPPESKWVRLSREKMPQAKALWKQELTAGKIPFEDYMLE